jgi:hypothetical protein
VSVEVRAGDHYYTKPAGNTRKLWKVVGKAIQIFQREKGEAPTEASHEGGLVEDGLLREVRASEAAAPKWHTIPARQAFAGKEFCVWRIIGLTDEQREMLGFGYTIHDGEAYNFPRIGGMAIDRVASWIKGSEITFFRNLAFLAENVCSTGIAQIHAIVRRTLAPWGVWWRRHQPDDGLDHDLEHEGEISEQVIPPKGSGQRWTTWEECVDRGWA